MTSSAILLILSLAAISIGCRKSFTAIPDPSYAIGIIDGYNSSPDLGSINFHFSVAGKTYTVFYAENQNGWNIPSGADLGPEYIVQYDSLSPSDARMLFCYRINDSTDYLNDVTQFAITPPACH